MPLKTQRDFDMDGGITIKPPPKGQKKTKEETDNTKEKR